MCIYLRDRVHVSPRRYRRVLMIDVSFIGDGGGGGVNAFFAVLSNSLVMFRLRAKRTLFLAGLSTSARAAGRAAAIAIAGCSAAAAARSPSARKLAAFLFLLFPR